ncbi:putative flippase GtrA [Azomonas agilis]|uniref:Putative flippase GtrA n=1 Tax=Azomonas agilis TaxID=116849 RepID=A0A562IYG1_9GAMM|nr:GtrA family protein [Azomonas agilis]TWH76039.1 putative flippase GtrA [Azomonas agilis]
MSTYKSVFPQFLRFLVVGTIGFIVNAGIVEFLYVHVGLVWCQLIAFPIAATCTWWLNRNYTFTPTKSSIFKEWSRYITANGLGWFINNGVYFFLVLNVSYVHMQPVLAVAAGSCTGLAFNFLMTRLFVFRMEKDIVRE